MSSVSEILRESFGQRNIGFRDSERQGFGDPILTYALVFFREEALFRPSLRELFHGRKVAFTGCGFLGVAH